MDEAHRDHVADDPDSVPQWTPACWEWWVPDLSHLCDIDEFDHEGLLELALGAVVSTVAGCTAYLISYDEALHRFPKPRARREGLRTALVAFAVFAALTAILAIVFAGQP
jgi:hypothetical protein